MATILTFTIGPGAEDYPNMTACRTANAKDLVAADEQHIYLFSVFAGGLDDNDAFAGYTDDATRNVVLRASPAATWDGINPFSGFYFKEVTGSSLLRPVGTCNFIELDGICIDGSSNGNIILSSGNGGDFKSITNCCFIDCPSDNVSSAIHPSIDNLLVINSGDDGVVSAQPVNKLTVINAANRGMVALSGSAITNSFMFGSSGADFSNQGGTHSNNATEDATAAGSSPQINRTSADFANFASDDFRTASGSALATAGTVDFIGYALESGAATTSVTTGTSVPTQTEADIVTGGKTIILTLTGDTFVTGTSSLDGIAAGSDSDIAASGTNWDSLIKTDLDNTNIALSVGDTVATITLPAYASYDVSSTETITWTIPAASLTTSAIDVVSVPTFTVTSIAVLPIITTEPLKNNTGQLLFSEVGVIAEVYDISDGTLVVRKTGLTSDVSGIVTFSDALMSAATEYRVVITLSGNEEGLARITTT